MVQLSEQEGFNTIAGFLMAHAGRLLNEADSVNYNGSKFIVERLEGRRIRRVRLIPHDSKDDELSDTAKIKNLTVPGICFLTASIWIV